MIALPNLQLAEKPEHEHLGHSLEVISIFDTFQGEGPFVGMPAVFIRLAGCNLACPLCDTVYTGPLRQIVHISTIVAHVKNFRKKGLVVITGGEPFRQNIGPLVRQLIDNGYHVQIETNGTLFLEDFPWYGPVSVVCSPKAPVVNGQLRPHVLALKYVVSWASTCPTDGLPLKVLGTECRVQRPWGGFKGEVFVNPADEGHPTRNKENLEEAMRVCRKFGYRLGIQVHKLIGVE
jgi:7-carboxy-7-deazaguanine synthase